MSIEKDQHIEGVPLTEVPDAQAIWDALEAEESGQAPAPAAAPAATDEPGASQQTDGDAAGADPAAPAADSGAEADPYRDLPASVRDEILGLKATVDALTGRVRNAEGHIGGLRSQIQRDLQAAAAATRQAGGDAPTQEQLATASKSPAALARLKEDYPEFGAAIEEVVSAQSQEIARLQQAISKPVVDDNAAKRVAQLEWELTDVKISVKHPNWKEEVAKPDFDPWVARQPREVQALRNSNNPADVIRLLDIRAAQVQAQRRTEQTQDQAAARRKSAAMKAAAIPGGRSAASIQTKDLDDMTPEELWAYYDAQDRAAASAHR